MALVTANNILVKNSTTTGESYHNVFYEWVLSGLKSTFNNEFKGVDVYIAPTILNSTAPFTIKLWGESAEIEQEFPRAWQKRYFISICMYQINKNANEHFYKQFYSDIERIHQLLFNNKQLTMTKSIQQNPSTIQQKVFTWIDGTTGEIEINQFEPEEEEIDGLHKAKFDFSCLVEREG